MLEMLMNWLKQVLGCVWKQILHFQNHRHLCWLSLFDILNAFHDNI